MNVRQKILVKYLSKYFLVRIKIPSLVEIPSWPRQREFPILDITDPLSPSQYLIHVTPFLSPACSWLQNKVIYFGVAIFAINYSSAPDMSHQQGKGLAICGKSQQIPPASL